MSQIILRSRRLLPLARSSSAIITGRLFCSSAAPSSAAAIARSRFMRPPPPHGDDSSPPDPRFPSASSIPIDPPPATAAGAEIPRKPWGFFKYSAFAAFTAALGTAAYGTYAYDLSEVGKKANELRAMSNFTLQDDASAFEKFQANVYTTAIKVPIKALDVYMDIRSSIEEQIQSFSEPLYEKLLPDQPLEERGALTLVLDLNETLVFSDWKRERGWRTFKRPGVELFLEHLSKFFEIVVYSDQPEMYVFPVVDRLDQKGCIRHRLTRNATQYVDGKHYRDLSKLNRDPTRIIYLSAHAFETSLQPENCVPIKAWKLENDDTALLDLIPFLEYVGFHRPADIRAALESYKGCDIPSEFIRRSKEQQRLQGQRNHVRFGRSH